jgi:hypothetical protein
MYLMDRAMVEPRGKIGRDYKNHAAMERWWMR